MLAVFRKHDTKCFLTAVLTCSRHTNSSDCVDGIALQACKITCKISQTAHALYSVASQSSACCSRLAFKLEAQFAIELSSQLSCAAYGMNGASQYAMEVPGEWANPRRCGYLYRLPGQDSGSHPHHPRKHRQGQSVHAHLVLCQPLSEFQHTESGAAPECNR